MTDETQVEQSAAPVQAEQQTPQGEPAADLNISDLIALKTIVEVASQRGSFKANELEGVGKVYNKLNTFLDSVAKKEGK